VATLLRWLSSSWFNSQTNRSKPASSEAGFFAAPHVGTGVPDGPFPLIPFLRVGTALAAVRRNFARNYGFSLQRRENIGSADVILLPKSPDDRKGRPYGVDGGSTVREDSPFPSRLLGVYRIVLGNSLEKGCNL
jgi:hypothetical protein